MPIAHVNDIDLYYEVKGEGLPVLLIPGLGVDLDYFRGIIDDLATTSRVLSFDPRGAGRSDKPDVPYSIEGMTADAIGLLASLDIKRATVLGCSMGGRIALTMALDHPRLVERLVLAASSARVPPAPLLTRRWLVMEVFSRLPMPESADAQPRYAWERQRQASVGFDCTDRLGELTMPTLVIHGKGDHLVPFRLGREMAGKIPGARLVTVPGGHRALFIGQGRRLVQEVRDFMRAP